MAVIIFSLTLTLFFFVCFAFFLPFFFPFSCFSPLPAVSAFPPLSAASLPQSPLSSPRSVPSASPRLLTGVSVDIAGVLFYHRATWESTQTGIRGLMMKNYGYEFDFKHVWIAK